MELDAKGELTTAHARLVASGMGVSLRTVWNWIAAARRGEGLGPGTLTSLRVSVTPELRARLAVWGGNVAAVHRELLAEATAAGDPTTVPSLRTLQRAVRQDLTPGERAGLQSGEAGRRRFDVYGKRPPVHRNACWEGDHKRIPVRVTVEGEVACPWVTWFVDVATKVITGVAVTPHAPARDAVLAALRTGISRTGPYGPAGGLPARVRVDRGKEFLCQAVTQALGGFAVPVEDLPAYTPYRKGTVEALNSAVEEMFLVSLPGYTHRARPAGAHRPDQTEDLLPFPDFVQALLGWVRWWNTEHHPSGLSAGQTPIAAWEADPTPIEDVDEEQLAFFALEDDGRVRKISTSGVRWRRRFYIAPWMVGHVGTRVRLRYLPHYDGQIEVFSAEQPGRHLGTAYLAEQATLQQRRALSSVREKKARALKADLKAAERLRRTRYTATTTPGTPRPRRTVTGKQAQEEIARAKATDLAARALPDLIPPRDPPPDWARPRPTPITRPNPRNAPAAEDTPDTEAPSGSKEQGEDGFR
ncbi:Mu transposase C-terminal domain-containing protein [Streptomyces sp. WMMB303]|uniref:Mu transposase C-terminal domain-containing protein n=1 Tax=Streptomyces sp. WMMB303 TaxID=3034154 RepID=UPI0023EC6592|nr:Mu transposase C-terminal domain-containing protein [Streptomyces sp. WMMB303]MDF4254594.1 Mu transposase C-terminal domain-containing protein [Streptomyces sp. WMMB303]